jgi:hypothetical protein
VSDATISGREPEADPAFSRALEMAGELYTATWPLNADRSTTLYRLRKALTNPTKNRLALLLMQVLHTDFTVALADVLTRRALSTRDTYLVRHLFARLPRDEAVGVVPNAVWRQLAETDDCDAYRRMAELLDHLGLDHALQQLAEAAAASDDPETREVGKEYGAEVEAG